MINHARIQKVQERMRERKMDAYLVLTHDDFIYLFGENWVQPRAIVPAEGQPVIIAFKAEEEEIRKSLGLKDVKIFGSLGEQMKDVIGVMRQLKGDKKTITVGVQMWFNTPAFLMMMFRKANPFVVPTDIAPVMDELRMFKDEGEIEKMRRAAEIASIGMKTAVEAVKPGITENEVAAEAEYAMRKAGGHGMAVPVWVNSGYRSNWLHGAATEKKIEKGELVLIDIVPVYRGYCSNLCRTFTVGPATGEQKKLFDTYKEARKAAVGAMKPGTAMKEIDKAAKAVFNDKGFGQYYIAGISHGIGLGFEETPAPTIKPGDSAVKVKEGMTLTAGHPVLSVPGIGGVRLEDTFSITADGPVALTDFPQELELPID